MPRLLAIALALAVVAASNAAAITVATPQGTAEVFARGELLDLLALLRLSGAEVAYAPAAGSYTALLGEHEVQFTPGGSLAVVDGRLTPLPGPIRTLEGHVVGSLATAAALLGPLGWELDGSAAEPRLLPKRGGEQITIDIVPSATGTLVVVRGTDNKPRLLAVPGRAELQFPAPIELTQAVPPHGEVLSVEARASTLVVRFAPGVEIAATYPLADPTRYVLRLTSGGGEPRGQLAERTGPLVVIDPGHGGDDQGARGPGGEEEKDITLAVARLTAQRLQAANVAARITREADETLPLIDRTSVANRLKADVFVSIHLNASQAKGARGAETYFMSADASDAQAAQAAERENASVGSDALQLILWDLAHVANLNASSQLARALQTRLNALHSIADRGVKQAPFVVLTGATMPAALVEIGFLSNSEEAQRLLLPEFQSEVAAALSDGIVEYLRAAPPAAVAAADLSPSP
jgi:N-acetylmuramoyl-L-alanine amidase